MNLNVAAPKVSIGGNLGINATAGIGGASLNIEAPKISMPSMSLNVAAPSLSFGVSEGATTWSGYYEHNGEQYDMELDMTVGNGRIVGSGSDEIGTFNINGRVNGDKFDFIK